jgi:hypothetical protein
MHGYSMHSLVFIVIFIYGLLRYDGLESRQTSKLRNRRSLFDVMNAIKYYSSWRRFHLSYPHWTVTYNYQQKYNEHSHRHRTQIDINSDKNMRVHGSSKNKTLCTAHGK